MKKILPLFLLATFLMSCGSHKRLSSNKTKKRKANTVIRRTKIEDSNTTKVHTIKSTKSHSNIRIDVAKNKTKFSTKLLDDLYQGRTDINKRKIDYIKKYGAIAIHEMEKYKIPASITLAQGLLESRYGQSILTTNANNHFGIKCHKAWEGNRVYHDDDAKGECFRKYEHAESSFRDHSMFLYHKKRYANLFKLAPNDYKGWAKGLRKAGYATDKKYPQKLIKLIEDYELYYFDNLVLGADFDQMEIVEKTNKEITKNTDKQLVNNTKSSVKEQLNKNTDNSDKIFINKNQIHIVGAGETLYAISRANNISIDNLKKWNNLTSNDISVGQELKMYNTLNQNVKNANNKEAYIYYVVKQGDTIYSIARKSNIKVADIMQVNNLESSDISIGQILKIKNNE